MFTEENKYPGFKPRNSFSQDGEDMILRSLLCENIANFDNYKGFFVDIGAHHPFRYSNTAYFYEQGWQGINIEPTPDAINLFEQYRVRDKNLNVGIGASHERRTLYQFKEPSLNTFDKELADSQAATDERYQVVGTAEVDIFPLAQILEEHLPEATVIDFMSIDVAGLDMQLLQSNDWEKYRPTYLLVEDVDNESGKVDASEIYTFLHDQGYEQLGYKTPRTLIFKAK